MVNRTIPMPELAQVQVSQLQATREAPREGALSIFMQNVLPQVSKGITDYQEKNKERQVVLGMNDKINGTVREQSFLDRKYYNQGRAVQEVLSTQAELRDKHDAAILAAAREGATEKELEGMRQEYNRTVVDAVYDADIDGDLRQQLYESVIKEHTLQSKAVDDTILKVGKENEAKAQGVRTATLARDLLTSDLTPATLQVTLDKYSTDALLSKRAAGVADPQAAADIESELSGVFDYLGEKIIENPTSPEAVLAVKNLELLEDAIIDNPNIPMGLSSKLQTISNKVRVKVMDSNANNLKLSLMQTLTNADADDNWDVNKANALIQEYISKYEAGLISQEDLLTLVSNVRSFHEAQNNRKISEKPSAAQIFASGITPSEFVANDYGSRDRWVAITEQGYLAESGGDYVAAGEKMMTHSKVGQEDIPELRRRGAQLFTRQFSQAFRMSPKEAAAMPNYKNLEANFARFSELYNKYKTGNNGKAALDLLEGIEDDQERALITDVLVGGGTLMDAIHKMQTPVESSEKMANISKQIEGISPKSLGMDDWFTNDSNSIAGSFGGILNKGKWMDQGVGEAQANAIKSVYKNSRHELSAGAHGTSTESLVVHARNKGLHFNSPKGYMEAVFNASTSRQLRSVKGSDGVAVPAEIIGKTLDNTRDFIAKTYKVDPQNIILTTYGTGGQYIIARAIDSKGNVVGNKSAVYEGTPIRVDLLMGDIKKTYDLAKGKASESVQKFQVQGGQVYQGRGYTAPKTYSVNTKGHFGRMNIRTDNGKTLNLNIPNTATIAFNGNVAVTQDFIGLLNRFETFSARPKHVQAVGKGSKNSTNIGHQMSMTANGAKWGKALRDAAATGDPQKIMDVQGKFMQESLPAIHKAATKLGLPVMDQGAYPAQHKNVMLMLADQKWHSSPTAFNAFVTNVLGAKDYKSAMTALRSHSTYTSTNPKDRESHPRNVWTRQVVMEYFNNRNRR